MSKTEKRGKVYRCILNDCGSITGAEYPYDYESCMKAAIYPVANSTVDAIFWNLHADLAGPYDAPKLWTEYLDPTPYIYVNRDGTTMGRYFENTRVKGPDVYNVEMDRRRYGTAQEAWEKHGIDITELVLEGAKKYGMDGWLSFRLNDMHHGDSEVHTKFWTDHPEYSLGDGAWGRDGHHGFDRTRVCFNFEFEEVREYVMAPILAAARCYKPTGFELDFTRHLYFFRKDEVNPPVLTEFIRTLKTRLDKIAEEMGTEPFKIAAKIMVGYEENLQYGFDYREWAKEGLIDYIVAGGLAESPDMPIDEIVDSVKDYGVLVYACYDALPFGAPERKYHCSREFLAAQAANIYEKGADGVYFFNYGGFSGNNRKGRESVAAGYEGAFLMGCPSLIKRADKIYSVGWEARQGDYKRQLPILLYNNKPDEEGKILGIAKPQDIFIDIADDVEIAFKIRDFQSYELQLVISETESGFDGSQIPQVSEKIKVMNSYWPAIDKFEVKINGRTVPKEAYLPSQNHNGSRKLRIDMLNFPEIAMKKGKNTVSMEITEEDKHLGSFRLLKIERMFVDIEYYHSSSIVK